MSGGTEPHAGRQVLLQEEWQRIADAETPPLLALWADTREVYALLRDKTTGAPLLVSTTVEAGCYPAMSPTRPAAVWFERMVHDLWGHEAAGGVDQRPWLDHGHWPHATPMALRPGPPGGPSEPPEFLASADEALQQIPLGPVFGGIEPSAHLRLSGNGETIARLETRLGYTHKGILTLMRGKSPRAAARFAARLVGEATVAHAIAFARATEAALQAEPPPRSIAWRGVMAEIERIACHLAALAAMADIAGLAVQSTHFARYEEVIRRAANAAFGHRLMMDCVVPGGLASDVAAGGAAAITQALADLAAKLPDLESLPYGHLSGVGAVTKGQAVRFAMGGVIGRAAGRADDVRHSPGYAPYASLSPAVAAVTAGDAEARARLRLTEIGESIRLISAMLGAMPDGDISVTLPTASAEGVGFAEGPGGDIWHWLRLDHGQIASVFLRDPGWAQWPLLETIMADGQADELPLILASFGVGCSGVDL